MKFEPRYGQAFGRIVAQPSTSSIVRPDETKDLTKFLLIDAAGPELEARGIRVGDVVVPTMLNLIKVNDGTVIRPFVEEKNIAFVVRDWTSLDEFYVQTDNASQYVRFDDPRAAKSLGHLAPPSPPRATAENGTHDRV